ncbi:UDP-4-amino-4,6-dideoxy-N-acetyl-beta-L-altrosamine N-acetyltransferase [Serpentinicella sp. ANB-PHB4]|uniref:UDP-4-amino-4, 6-dideoxy-N-acetyl-beta-L-altrosamine N-acetyltransferase n=1 Tax=Serpentinicella sp. ANB-PHB4 TaxID=3074076 RepID=UPI00285866E2|nr:UDP-4-amino-4,6-dideoxy-N-acetyl-beta-L-altrosamine N-acetyltransferase [Serpentinicella sp. ANB-PHB4]MDR5659782.1 UDP-4-amino-4,6-dideoxy-N-acetyl-beta-L-altrosamine N-acetyltransferase [Serpentinicella sp. ANB-PHB4]
MALKLTKVTEDDLELIMNWRMKPSVTKYMYTDPRLTIEGQKNWLENIKESCYIKYWVIRMDGVRIGLVNVSDIDLINKRCTWAYYIGDTSFRGKGLAGILECNIYDYVFDVLKLNKLCCEVFSFNDKVISIHQRFGSVIEGTLKQHIYKDGNYFDIVCMGITKDRWYKIKNTYNYEKILIE